MNLSPLESFNLAIIVLFVGMRLNGKVPFLRQYNIPEPVTGGLLFCVLSTLVFAIGGIEISVDLSARDFLLLYFFSAIGLNSDFRSLLAGGLPLVILLAATVVYMFAQNFTGVGVAMAFGQPAVSGLLSGTTSLIGGHGTAIAWAPTFESEYGVSGAMEIGVASATCGLVMASLMGGPVASFLMKRHKVQPPDADTAEPDVGISNDTPDQKINAANVMRSLFWLNVCVGLGAGLNEAFEAAGIKLPQFVTSLFVGILLTNTLPLAFKKLHWPSKSYSLALISEISLGIFLSMSLMSLQLWTLVEMAGPLFVTMGAQLVVAFLFTILVIYNIMGRDYEAVVISAGFSGISLGATPTAMANMTAVTKQFGPAHKAFIIVPLVCGFFVDIVNSVVINLFLGWFG